MQPIRPHSWATVLRGGRDTGPSYNAARYFKVKASRSERAGHGVFTAARGSNVVASGPLAPSPDPQESLELRWLSHVRRPGRPVRTSLPGAE